MRALRVTDLSRRLAVAIPAKLDFDFACNRGHSFGEYHVHGVINEILCAQVDSSDYTIEPNFPAFAIQKQNSRGMRAIDFAIARRMPDGSRPLGTRADPVDIAVEVKWAKSSYCTPMNVLSDLNRLSLIVDAGEAKAGLLVVAGPRRDVIKLMKSPEFHPSESHYQRPLAMSALDTAVTCHTRISSHLRKYLNPKMRRALEENGPIADSFRTQQVRPCIRQDDDWRVLVWRVG